MILAVVGLYGVVSYSVVSRRREFGIRMAVGARRGDVVEIVLRETAWTGIVSVLAAVPLIIAGGHWLRSLLYGAAGADTTIYSIAISIVLTFALVAGLLPAIQAAHTDPQLALRAE